MSKRLRLRTAERSESGRGVRPSMTYQSAVEEIRRPSPNVGAEPDYRELIRNGSLAASSHNTQPWKFSSGGGSIRVLPDFSRRCPVVDPDDAHLFKSLGCAAENIVHAAAAQGLRADVDFDDNDRVVVVQLTADPTCGETALARAIPLRQCTKARYDGRPLDSEDLATLEEAGTGDGVRLILLTDDDQKRTVTEFVNMGNQSQLSDPAWRTELFSWIRSNDRESLETGDGLSGRTSGQPSAPTWLARLILPLLVRPKSQMKTDAANIQSAAGVAVFVTEEDTAAAWVEAG
ncbi:MAG: Tat pathway signal protein, partial [Actinomycetota bacterium]|nr:Tat pathway signal protein [Actinomycetota bacterium]